jgi:hypothetical protein
MFENSLLSRIGRVGHPKSSGQRTSGRPARRKLLSSGQQKPTEAEETYKHQYYANVEQEHKLAFRI